MRMSNVPARFASALFLGVVAGAGSSALPLNTAYAADCLTEPKGETPQGKHWYYRSERGTGRQCWYLRGEDEKSARADTTSADPAEKPAPQRTEAATSRSIAEAHAEIGPRTRVPEAAPSVWPSPQAAAPAANNPVATAPAANAPAAPLTSRWSGQTSGQAAAPAASPQPEA